MQKFLTVFKSNLKAEKNFFILFIERIKLLLEVSDKKWVKENSCFFFFFLILVYFIYIVLVRGYVGLGIFNFFCIWSFCSQKTILRSGRLNLQWNSISRLVYPIDTRMKELSMLFISALKVNADLCYSRKWWKRQYLTKYWSVPGLRG